MKPRLFWCILIALFSISFKVAAQATPICPAPVLFAFSRSGSACFTLERNQACYGNGSVSATAQDSAQVSEFVKAGDIAALDQLRSISTVPSEGVVSIANLSVQASLSDTEAHSMTALLFGDVTVTNNVDYLPEIAVTAKGTLNIRTTPDANADIIVQLALNKGVIANGRTADKKWLRVHVPDSQALGWVAAEIVSAQQNLDTLSIVDTSSPVHRPFQVMTVKTGDAALCGGKVAGGVLLQTPNITQSVDLSLNGVDIQVAGTTFVQTLDSGYLTINVLDGSVQIVGKDKTEFIPAGARIRIPIDTASLIVNGEISAAEPYVDDDLVGLPLNNMPNRVKLVSALTAEQIVALQTQHNNEQVAAANASTPEPRPVCRYITTGTATLWAGPGEFYEAINEIHVDARIYPTLQITDANGQLWWQLNNNNWIHANAVRQVGDCPDIPVTNVIPAQPTNTLSLETCKSQNGPLRVGQEVTIEFTPPAFENYYDASIALNVDPGRITIDEQYQSVGASKPITIGTAGTDQERYVRIFSTHWTATGGAHKIISKRLSYILTCNITVPFG